eukprot:622648_1
MEQTLFWRNTFRGTRDVHLTNKKQLYIYEGFEQILWIIDIQTMNIIQHIPTPSCETEAFPVLTAHDNTVHIISGQSNKHHLTIDITNGNQQIVHTFDRTYEG